MTAADILDLAAVCDSPPRGTSNIKAAEVLRACAGMVEELETISSGEVGINLCVKYSKQALARLEAIKP